MSVHVCFYTPVVYFCMVEYTLSCAPLVCMFTWAWHKCLYASIQLWAWGVVIVGLSIFHVLLACLFPPSNSLWGGGKEGKKRRTQDPCFGSSSFLRLFEALFISYFFSSGSVFVLGAAFLVSSCIFRVKGSLCALLLDLRFWKKVHWRDGMWGDEEREGGREKKREMKGERKRDREGRKRLGEEAWTKASYQSCQEPIVGPRQTSP